MIALRTTKNCYKLAVKTLLTPTLKNDTRWDSGFAMVAKGDQLKKILSLCQFNHQIKALFPSTPEWSNIAELSQHLSNFLVVSKWLRTEKYQENRKK